MATPVFPIPYGPIFPVERDITPRVNSSSFGDGYQQRFGDGINIIQPTTDVVWEGLTFAEQQQSLNFLVEMGGITGFMWTYPGDTAPSKWTCQKWADRFIGANDYGINATFLRDFNP